MLVSLGGQLRRRAFVRLYSQFPSQLPSDPSTPSDLNSASNLNSRWGAAVLEAALIHKLRSEPNAVEKLDTLLDKGAVRLVALSLGYTRLQLFEKIAQIGEKNGYDAASEWISQIYAPYIKTKTGHIAASPMERSPQPSAVNGAAGANTVTSFVDGAYIVNGTLNGIATGTEGTAGADAAKDAVHGMDISGSMKPIDLYADEMNLFDPESWLKESPTAQRIWKEQDAS